MEQMQSSTNSLPPPNPSPEPGPQASPPPLCRSTHSITPPDRYSPTSLLTSLDTVSIP